MQKIILISILFLFTFNPATAQKLDNGQKPWDADKKLQLDDFKIKTSTDGDGSVYSQFLISHQVGKLNFLKRNFNRNVETIYLGNASWIDTTKTYNIARQINFQQMQFDLAEIAARKFRKQLLKNKGHLAPVLIDQINDEIIDGFSEERKELIEETNDGRDDDQVETWKKRITEELKTLDDFRYDNKDRIEIE